MAGDGGPGGVTRRASGLRAGGVDGKCLFVAGFGGGVEHLRGFFGDEGIGGEAATFLARGLDDGALQFDFDFDFGFLMGLVYA